ncbi:MAG: bifunctional diaminohydroxyphosphoribosylaminopyrimidine deaminase/5-amino-6-(5-phosphoribosylamino)uracil reductase RibD [Alicyclobacillaceae bacterium]|nr:bifunctional diaminohydroxyphosphoribosylaminopyrimidine deaminase/5-amino-6-(5-phosphoribosylamino)uracil reductase RibD [Alicyclobacillaceae bacterium]
MAERSQEDERFMRMALQVGRVGRGQTSPNPAVGCVLVKDGEVVGQGAHLRAGGPHAEVHALRMAGPLAHGATAYVTLEPCSHYGRTPPCCDQLIAAGVRRVVAAMTDPNPQVSGRGLERLRAAGVEVVTGVLAEEAAREHEAFITWVRKGRPFVVWKCAATLDGYIACATGDSRYVTSAAARAAVHAVRREMAAIGVGVGTVLADDPQLTARTSPDGPAAGRQPVRVVFDSHLRIPLRARLLAEPGETVVYTTTAADPAKVDELCHTYEGRLSVHPFEPGADGRVPLAAALADLARRGCHSLLIEGGSRLASAFLRARLVDKVIYYVAPKLLGGGLQALAGLNVARMADAVSLAGVRWTAVGSDMQVEGYPVYDSGARPG